MCCKTYIAANVLKCITIQVSYAVERLVSIAVIVLHDVQWFVTSCSFIRCFSLLFMLQELFHVCCSKSFMLSSAGFTCVSFVSGALALWAPEYMIKSLRIQSSAVNETKYVRRSHACSSSSSSSSSHCSCCCNSHHSRHWRCGRTSNFPKLLPVWNFSFM